MLTYRAINFSYDHQPLFSDFTLELQSGQTTALIGSSGSGKSTLLRLALGLLKPERGELLVNGRHISAAELPALRLATGYVIQSGGLFPHMSAERNIALMARRSGWSLSRIEQRLNQLTEMLGLEHSLLERLPAQLSGGQRQRVALARALMLDPPLLLLDEPFSALDPPIRVQLQQEMEQLARELQKTVVLVTHDMAEAAWLADHLVLLDRGTIIQQGSFAEFRDQPASELVSAFLGAARGLPS